MLIFLLINVDMPTIVGILTFMGKKNFMLSSVEHEKTFITSGPDWLKAAHSKQWLDNTTYRAGWYIYYAHMDDF